MSTRVWGMDTYAETCCVGLSTVFDKLVMFMFVATPVIPAASRNVARDAPLLPLWSATKSRKVSPAASYLLIKWNNMETK